NQTTVAPSALAVNTWTHLAARFDGAAGGLYMNGELGAGQAQTAPLVVASGALQIGAGSLAGQGFAGRIDEMRIYNRALSQAGIQSDMNTAIGGTPAPDTTAPTTPAALTATPMSSSQINLSWTASMDNVGVTGYRVERCVGASCTSGFVELTPAPPGPSFSDTGAVPATSYGYRVRARDAAGNLSGFSPIAAATTPDTGPPTAPSGR